MKTFIYSIGLFLLSFGALNAQPFIESHFLDNEYCPNTIETVELIVPSDFDLLNIAPSMNVISVDNITFENFGVDGDKLYTFELIFPDVNQTAQIYVTFQDPNDDWDVDTWDFTNIQSFAISEAESTIQPNVTSLLVPICGSLIQNITFPNVRFSNADISGDAFGEAIEYEYDIPDNWLLADGGSAYISNGTDFIVGSNNVTISSNATPVDGVIRIRPINTCNANLTAGDWVEIPVIRDIPDINIEGDIICGSPEGFDFGKDLSVIPSWAVGWTWSASPSSLVSIQGPDVNTNSITVVPVPGVSGTATISLTLISDANCNQSITYTRDVFVGNIPSTPVIQGPDCYDPGENVWITVSSSGANSFHWAVPNDWIIYTQNPSPSNQAFIHIGNQAGSISVWATNECGTVSKNEEVEFCDDDRDEGPIKGFGTGDNGGNAQWMQQMQVFPNPASDELNIKFKVLPDNQMDDMRVNLLDVNGKVLRRVQVQDYDLQMNVSDLPAGMYYLQVLNGEEMSYQKVIIK